MSKLPMLEFFDQLILLSLWVAQERTNCLGTNHYGSIGNYIQRHFKL